MSISGALSNAVSGLAAVGRGTQTVSSNLANALTPGYARREIELSPRTHANHAGGVQVDRVTRVVSDGALAAMRLASANANGADTAVSFAGRIETATGTLAESGSLGGRLAAFDQSLTLAIARPDNALRLEGAVQSAAALVEKINTINTTIEQARTDADAAIANQVDRLNSGLSSIADLNRKITAELARTGDASSLMDQRQKVIDDIAGILPVKELPREHGKIAIFTQNGQPLLDGTEPVKIGFKPAGHIGADMTKENGALHDLTFDGKDLADVQRRAMDGGSLGALFDFRDKTALTAQNHIDAFAHELYTRFADNTLDPSLGSSPGLFTDDGGAMTQTTGLAGRLRLNPALTESAWKLRDGIGATQPGPVGDSGLLRALSDRLHQARPAANAAFAPGQKTLTTLAGEVMSQAATARVRSETAKVAADAHLGATTKAFLADGVDQDREMEHLLQLEKAYTANARVIQTAFDMLDTILRIKS